MKFKTLALLFALTLPLAAQQPRKDNYKASVILLIAANAADAGSSWGQPELNPLLASDGRYGARGLAMKSGITVGTLWLQHRLLKNHPKWRKPFTFINFGVAIGIGSVATRNWRH